LGWLRDAPFGVPVVPEVRITALPASLGGITPERSPRSIRLSSVGSFVSASGSAHAM